MPYNRCVCIYIDIDIDIDIGHLREALLPGGPVVRRVRAFRIPRPPSSWEGGQGGLGFRVCGLGVEGFRSLRI